MFNLDLTDGLGNGFVHALCQDRKGYIWCGTAGGAIRFDGDTFKTFTTRDGLAHDVVLTLLEDEEGRLWFGTRGGVSCYDGRDFRTFTVANGLPHNTVRAISTDGSGNLWFGTPGGVSRYTGDSFTAFSTADGLGDNFIFSIVRDQQGYLWFGTRGGVSRYDGCAFQTFTTDDGLAHPFVKALWGDRQGHLWLGTPGGLSRYDGCAFQTFTTDDGLAHPSVNALWEDHQGHLWLGSPEGVSRYDGCTFQTFTTDDGLDTNGVHSLLQDREGHLWIGRTSGISRFDFGAFLSLETVDGHSIGHVRAITQDLKGALWFGTWNGAIRYDGTGLTYFAHAEGMERSASSVLQDRQGVFWFGIDDGDADLVRYDGSSFSEYGIEGNLFTQHGQRALVPLLQDRNGSIWFSPRIRGLCCFDGDRMVHYGPEDGLMNTPISALLEDREGYIWCGTANGLSCFDGRGFTSFRLGDNEEVLALAQDGTGDLWVGTQNGIFRFDGQTFSQATLRPGLEKVGVRAILCDRHGHLWFGTTGGGVLHFDGRVAQVLTVADGLAGNIVEAIFQDKDGNYWFGTNQGATRYQPSEASPVPVYIDAVVADRRYENVEAVELSSTTRLAAFEFHGVSFKTRPGGMIYQHRLLGRDEGWQTTEKQRVEYPELEPGSYLFQVRAIDRDLNYSEAAEVPVRVEPDALVESLTAALAQSSPRGEFVGQSPALRKVQGELRQVAPAELTVLIQGETGTGKGLAARTLHELSPRGDKPFVQVNCGGMPEPLIESELFGHEKGAFTGAVARRLGKVELARGGTLFLDEIGDMSPAAQVKLLRLLEERTFERVGGGKPLKAEVRVVAATNRNLQQAVAEDRFRKDLYFRLQGFEIHLPPLRQRREDVPLLALYFIDPVVAHLHKKVNGLSRAAEEALVAYDWPGNVRELMHVIERAVVVCTGTTIQVGDLRLDGGPVPEAEGRERMTLEEHERRYIRAVLEDTEGIISGPRGAAKILGLNEGTLRARMKKLGIKRLRS